MALSRAQIVRPLSRDPSRAAALADILKAVAHPLRLRIVAILCDGDEHVNALAESLGAPQAIVSQQLGILRARSLVAVERRDGHAYYRINEPRLQDLIQCIQGCRTH